MPEDPKTILKELAQKCQQHLNSLRIPLRIGKHKLELSSRTLSDLVEKHTVDFMIDYFGQGKVKFKSWRGYDVIVIAPEGPIYVNIKTAEFGGGLDATWLFSASIVPELDAKSILARLYCVKFEYAKKGADFLEFLLAKVAGPVSEIELIYYTRGAPPPCKLRAEFNGSHCHLPNRYYE